MSCGNNVGDGVSGRYSAQYRPIGTNKKVTVDISNDLIQDDETEVRRIMAKQ